ncbi:MAG: hypothetical protein JXD23_00480 [Spirochaetales bacterium]|nr:hypothetical protein [Spirochaetales bacterium]
MIKKFHSKYFLLLICITLYACNAIIIHEIPSGTPLWAQYPITENTLSGFVSTSCAGDAVYAAGFLMNGQIQIGNGVTAKGISTTYNLLLVKYDNDGKALWAKYPISGGNSIFSNVKFFNNVVFVIGNISSDAFDLGDSVTITASSYERMILVKYSSHGNVIFAQTTTGNASCSALGLDVNNDGVFVIGKITGPGLADFGNNVQINLSGKNSMAFIVKYNKNGIAQWLKTATSASDSFFSSIALSNDGIFLAGTFSGTDIIDFGNAVEINGQYSDANPMIVKYSHQGDPQWARTTVSGTDGSCGFNSIDVNDQIVCVAGTISGQNQFKFAYGVNIKGISEGTNLAVVAYEKNGTPLWARTSTCGNHSSQFTGIRIDENNIYVCGTLGGFDTFGFGNGVYVDAIGGENPLLVKYNSNGTAQWAKSLFPPITGMGYADFCQIDSENNSVYAIGAVSYGTFNFGNNVSVTGYAYENCLVLKYMK